MDLLDFLSGAVVNLFVLFGFVTLCALMRDVSEKRQRKVAAWEIGLLFGVMAVVAMLAAVETPEGMIFDCRAGVIGAGALLAGPLAALVSVPLPCAYRWLLGGEGALPGVMEVILPAIFGSICHLWLRRRHNTFSLSHVLLASLLTGLGANVFIFAFVMVHMPDSTGEMGLPGAILILLNAPVSMALLSTLVQLEKKHFEAVESLADSERRMLHSQKMAAVGQLSRKVAHTFANALTTILGSAQMVKDGSIDEASEKHLMGDVIETVGRLSYLTTELLSFSTPGSLRLRQMPLSKGTVGIRQFLGNSLPAGIEIVMEADKNAGDAMIDPDRIEQAILHMAVNAAEAMEGKGRLTVGVLCANLTDYEKEVLQAGIHGKDRHSGDFALLSVEDTGKGMDQEIVSRIFEPFFTTKEKRENVGLGLSTVYNIVQQHHGCIDVISRVGHGTTFLIYLPVVEKISE
ncbi:ATP-binding protein [Verrucomicrobiota bacterium]